MNQQRVIVIRALRSSFNNNEEWIDFPWLDITNWYSNPHQTQSQVTSILGNMWSKPGWIPYAKIAVVHSHKPSRDTEQRLMDRIRRFSGYNGIEELGWRIALLESESDTEWKIKAFLDEHFQTSKKILMIIGWLPWAPALINEWLDLNGTKPDMPLEEMQYMFPSWYAFSFDRKTK